MNALKLASLCYTCFASTLAVMTGNFCSVIAFGTCALFLILAAYVFMYTRCYPRRTVAARRKGQGGSRYRRL